MCLCIPYFCNVLLKKSWLTPSTAAQVLLWTKYIISAELRTLRSLLNITIIFKSYFLFSKLKTTIKCKQNLHIKLLDTKQAISS